MESEHILLGWERFFEELEAFVKDINRHAGSANESYCDYACERLEVCTGSMYSLVNLLGQRPAIVTDRDSDIITRYQIEMSRLLQCLRGLETEWLGYCNEQHTSDLPPVSHSSSPGRPKFMITQEQIYYLRSMSFSWMHIAKLFGVSYMTIYRRRQEFGMTGSDDGRSITDNELYVVVRQLRHEIPSLGQTMVWGRLRSMGFRVTRYRVRQAMRENDPLHTALRWRGQLVQRQPYSVPGPNSLWHLGEQY